MDIRVRVVPAAGSEIRFGDGDWALVPPDGVVVRSIDRAMTVTARNPCCEIVGERVRVGQAELDLDMRFKPGRVVPICDAPDTAVQIDDRSVQLGKPTPIWFPGTLDTKTAKVTFIGSDKVDNQTVNVRSGMTTEVKCGF
jgi:hypothetical protein